MGKKLQQNIKKYREMKNMTLEELAEKIGVGKATIHKYESGLITNIPSDKIEEMAKVFECSPSELMGWEELASNLDFLYKNDNDNITFLIESCKKMNNSQIDLIKKYAELILNQKESD